MHGTAAEPTTGSATNPLEVPRPAHIHIHVTGASTQHPRQPPQSDERGSLWQPKARTDAGVQPHVHRSVPDCATSAVARHSQHWCPIHGGCDQG